MSNSQNKHSDPYRNLRKLPLNIQLAVCLAKSYPDIVKHNFYSVEAVSVEKISDRGIHETITKGQSLDADASNKISQLLASVKSYSHILDENYEPLVVYHGTEYGGFTEFDKDYIRTEDGFWFTDDKTLADEPPSCGG